MVLITEWCLHTNRTIPRTVASNYSSANQIGWGQLFMCSLLLHGVIYRLSTLNTLGWFLMTSKSMWSFFPLEGSTSIMEACVMMVALEVGILEIFHQWARCPSVWWHTTQNDSEKIDGIISWNYPEVQRTRWHGTGTYGWTEQNSVLGSPQ